MPVTEHYVRCDSCDAKTMHVPLDATEIDREKIEDWTFVIPAYSRVFIKNAMDCSILEIIRSHSCYHMALRIAPHVCRAEQQKGGSQRPRFF